MAPRGPSAYMLFANEQRAAVQAELAAEGGKVGVAQVGKELGARWNTLSDEDKQKYKDLAAQKAAELAEQAAAAAAAAAEAGENPDAADAEGGEGAEAGGDGGASTSGAAAQPFGLPLGLIKKIALVDGDVKRISADGLRALAKATEMFVGSLAVKALETAKAGKRKNFKFEDIVHAAKRDRRCQDMGLAEILEHDQVFAAIHDKAAEENEARRANASRKGAEKAEKAAKGSKQITAFFSAAPAAGSNAAEAAPAAAAAGGGEGDMSE